MKKLFKRALFLAIIGTVIVGCEKEENQSIQFQNESIVENNKSDNHSDIIFK